VQDLHQTDRVLRAHGVGIATALGGDQRGDEMRIDPLRGRVAQDQRLPATDRGWDRAAEDRREGGRLAVGRWGLGGAFTDEPSRYSCRDRH
jgi:hypothetical protein